METGNYCSSNNIRTSRHPAAERFLTTLKIPKAHQQPPHSTNLSMMVLPTQTITKTLVRM